MEALGAGGGGAGRGVEGGGEEALGQGGEFLFALEGDAGRYQLD